METVMKRKNIDLPVETLQKLSIMAVAQGRSLKSYIESILISKANTINIEGAENPSPSGDEWFDDPANIEEVKKGIDDIENGRVRPLSLDDVRKIMNV
jgi:hypothetical protein